MPVAAAGTVEAAALSPCAGLRAMNIVDAVLGARPVHVAAAVIRRPDGRVLVSLRKAEAHQGGLWEFPGGKLEPAERHVDGLARELEEELGIVIEHAIPLIRIDHRYPDKHVALDVLEVVAWDGDPAGREGQRICWVEPDGLAALDFPAANLPIRTALNLPHLALVASGAGDDQQVFLERLEACLAAGVELVQLRVPGDAAGRALAAAARGLCRGSGALLMVDGAAGDVLASGADGLHLGPARMRQLSTRPIGPDRLLSSACRNRAELEHAERLGVDFAYVTPVHASASRPQSAALGWHRLRRLVRRARIPVFALGGMVAADTRMARRVGCQGVALQRALWEAAEPAVVVRSSAAACAGAAYRVQRRGM